MNIHVKKPVGQKSVDPFESYDARFPTKTASKSVDPFENCDVPDMTDSHSPWYVDYKIIV